MPLPTVHPREGRDPGFGARTGGGDFEIVQSSDGLVAQTWVPAFAGMHGN